MFPEESVKVEFESLDRVPLHVGEVISFHSTVSPEPRTANLCSVIKRIFHHELVTAIVVRKCHNEQTDATQCGEQASKGRC